MEQPSTMDKKNQLRSTPPASKTDSSKTGFEYPTKKSGVQYARKREYDKIEAKKSSNRGCRASQRNVRSREKMGCQVESKASDSEFGSLQNCGGKKQNITHLLNWWGPGPERHARRFAKEDNYGYRTKKLTVQSMKYSKEHYLHANCQFIVASEHDYALYENDPDHLIDWELVEEVRLHVTEAPACPICLHPPIAAKVTRCGHIYCFACVLHYLALTDESWRKCPICFDIITLEDLKSATSILHKEFCSGQEIELKLMKRERACLVPVPVAFFFDSSSAPPSLSNPDQRLAYSKFIKASKQEVSEFIVAREIAALEYMLAIEGDEPEACFIKEALMLTSLRKEQLENEAASSSEEDVGAATINCEVTLCKSFDKTVSVKDEDEERRNALASMAIEEKTLVSIGACSDSVQANICAEDLDIGPLQENALNCGEDVKESPKPCFYFYQESSGAQIYLHALNVHMLVKEYGCLEKCPHTIKAKVIEKESDSMSDALRQRLRYLRHLPLSCPFEVVEIDLSPPLVSQLTIATFEPQLEQRERKRRKRAKEEYRIQRRVQVQEDKLMGRSKGTKINMTSLKHFPSFTENFQPNNIYEDEPAVASEPVAAAQEEFPNLSPPSFAQMTRCGQKKNDVLASSLRSSQSCNQTSYPTRGSRRDGFSDDEIEEGERVPDFSAAFSDDFAKALDQATQRLSNPKPCEENVQRGKKGKRKKGIVLLSSGGR